MANLFFKSYDRKQLYQHEDLFDYDLRCETSRKLFSNKWVMKVVYQMTRKMVLFLSLIFYFWGECKPLNLWLIIFEVFEIVIHVSILYEILFFRYIHILYSSSNEILTLIRFDVLYTWELSFLFFTRKTRLCLPVVLETHWIELSKVSCNCSITIFAHAYAVYSCPICFNQIQTNVIFKPYTKTFIPYVLKLSRDK